MTVQEFYDAVGGNYSEAMGRLMTEARVTKYVLKFAADDNYAKSLEALDAKNWEQLFLYTHNLKGVALNLCLGELGNAAATLCDMVRHGAPTESVDEPAAAMKAAYEKTAAAIEKLKESC